MSIGNGPANNVSDLIYTVPTLQCLNLSHDFSASTSLCSASYSEINAPPLHLSHSPHTHIGERSACSPEDTGIDFPY